MSATRVQSRAQVDRLVDTIVRSRDVEPAMQFVVAIVGTIVSSGASTRGSDSHLHSKRAVRFGDRLGDVAGLVESAQSCAAERRIPVSVIYIGSSAREFRQLDQQSDAAVIWLAFPDTRSVVSTADDLPTPDLLFVTGNEGVWHAPDLNSVLCVLTSPGTFVMFTEGSFTTFPSGMRQIDSRTYMVKTKIPMPQRPSMSVKLRKGGSV